MSIVMKARCQPDTLETSPEGGVEVNLWGDMHTFKPDPQAK